MFMSKKSTKRLSHQRRKPQQLITKTTKTAITPNATPMEDAETRKRQKESELIHGLILLIHLIKRHVMSYQCFYVSLCETSW